MNSILKEEVLASLKKFLLGAHWLLLLLIAVACEQQVTPTPPPVNVTPESTIIASPQATATLEPSATPTRPSVESTNTPTPTDTPPRQSDITPCGVLMPAVLPDGVEPQHEWQEPILDDALIPPDAKPAIERFFSHPNDVSLAVYRLGYEGVGFYHNEAAPMPLASVSKLIQLVAYANQVDAGILTPQQSITEADLERFYLPRSDLNAHRRALAALGDQPLTLGDVIPMMITYSSNSAADYLQTLLGQSLMEETVLELGMTQHSAPCSFIGRFLIMGDGSDANSNETIRQLGENGMRYGVDVAERAERYLTDEVYRAEAGQFWQRRRSPAISTQALFVDQLETRGTAADYARLMGQIVQGDIGSAETNRQLRDALEWPYEAFPNNQDLYQTIGYKNGTLPGTLTSVYYSWPHDSDQPYVLALFYRNLPLDVYQQWRRDLPHDAFAHWLMSEPNALHIMHVLRDSAAR